MYKYWEKSFTALWGPQKLSGFFGNRWLTDLTTDKKKKSNKKKEKGGSS